MKRFLKWLGIILIICIICFAGVGVYAFGQLKKMQEGTEVIEKGELTKKPFAVVLMGLDLSEKREDKYGSTARTDALIVTTINPNTGAVNLLSIPRDCRVYLPMQGYNDKINHAYAYDGVEGTMSTLSQWLETEFTYYATINFDGFVHMVDAIGGITVNVPVEIKEQNSQDKAGAIHLMPGVQKVNGEEALALVRMRKADSDMARGERQMLVVQAFVNEVLSLGSVKDYPKLAKIVGENVKTNMSFSELGILGFKVVREGTNLTFNSYQIQGYNTMMNGVYYYQPNDQSVREEIQRLHQNLEITQ